VPLPVDAGRHVIKVSATGKRTWETTVEAAGEGATITVTIPALKEEPEVGPLASSSASVAPSAQASAAPAVAADAGWSTARKAALGLGAAGFVGLVAGGIFGGLAADRVGASNKLCTQVGGGAPDQCQLEGDRLRKEANAFANGANVGVLAGATLAVAGVVLWLVAPATDKPSKAGRGGVRAAVVAGPQGAMIQLGRAW